MKTVVTLELGDINTTALDDSVLIIPRGGAIDIITLTLDAARELLSDLVAALEKLGGDHA